LSLQLHGHAFKSRCKVLSLTLCSRHNSVRATLIHKNV
jgi:hypothetical protein